MRHATAWPTSACSQFRRSKQHAMHLVVQRSGFEELKQRLEAAAAQVGLCAWHRLLHFLPQFDPASTRSGEAIAPSAAAPRTERDARRETVAAARRANASKLEPFIKISRDREARIHDQDRRECRRHPSAHVPSVQPDPYSRGQFAAPACPPLVQRRYQTSTTRRANQAVPHTGVRCETSLSRYSARQPATRAVDRM
jgi:hypothetical protein